MYCLQVNCSSVQYINKDWCYDYASGRAHPTVSFLLLKKGSCQTPSPACPWGQSAWENSFLQNQVVLLDLRSWGSLTLRWLLSLLPTNVSSWSRVTAASPHLKCDPFSAPRKAYRQLFDNCSSCLVFRTPASFGFVKNKHLRALGQKYWPCRSSVTRARTEAGDREHPAVRMGTREPEAKPAVSLPLWGNMCRSEAGSLMDSGGGGVSRWDG